MPKTYHFVVYVHGSKKPIHCEQVSVCEQLARRAVYIKTRGLLEKASGSLVFIRKIVLTLTEHINPNWAEGFDTESP